MTITIDQLVSREVHYCVSYLVSTLASGYGALDSSTADLSDAAEQAAELCSPLADYEEAAIQAGWRTGGENAAYACTVERDPIAANGEMEIEAFGATNWKDAGEHDGIDPYEREVFEHWIVSSWLAGKLAEQGEKVDTDFCGMTVWARTTTGQGIASDSVIKRIYADMIAA